MYNIIVHSVSYEAMVADIYTQFIEPRDREIERLKEALKQIAQMSDCGSPELAIVRMKAIASNTLATSPAPSEGENLKK